MKNLTTKALKAFAATCVVISLLCTLMVLGGAKAQPQVAARQVSFYLTQNGSIIGYQAVGEQPVGTNHMLWFAQLDSEAAARNSLYENIKVHMLSAGGQVRVDQRYGFVQGKVRNVNQTWTLQDPATGAALQVMYVKYMEGTEQSGMAVSIQCVMTSLAMPCPSYGPGV